MSQKYIHSPLNYVGGKHKLLKQILPLFPNNLDIFVDLFCGGCNVGINMDANKIIYNDINERLIGVLSLFKNYDSDKLILDFEEIINKYDLSDTKIKGYEHYNCNSSEGLKEYNDEKFRLLRSDLNKIKVYDESYYKMLFVVIVFAFNNKIRFNRKGEFNNTVGKRDLNQSIIEKIKEFSDKLHYQECEFKNVKFYEIDLSDLTKNSLVYCDPPYLITDVVYNENGRWGESDEKKLLEFLDDIHNKNVKFALSNVLSHGDKVNDILNIWLDENKDKYFVYHLDSSYSNSNYRKKERVKKSDEVLILNYKI